MDRIGYKGYRSGEEKEEPLNTYEKEVDPNRISTYFFILFHCFQNLCTASLYILILCYRFRDTELKSIFTSFSPAYWPLEMLPPIFLTKESM